MFSKRCACGIATKNFHRDIGDFYVDECCLAAGYDELGKLKNPTPEVKSSVTDKVLNLVGLGQTNPVVLKRPGRGKLRDLRVEELKNLAKTQGIVGNETMTKNQLIEALLK
jgi:hypothetical protein